jgi:acyl-CoA synthetase (AMP-forming)/AMP-acid ligase II
VAARVALRGRVSPARSFVDVLLERACSSRSHAGYVFLADGETREQRLSYAGLDARARAVAAELQARGAAGERVLLVLEPGPDFVAALFGCLYAGALAVPLAAPEAIRPDAGLQHVQRVARDCGASLGLVGRDIRKRSWPEAVSAKPAPVTWIEIEAIDATLAQAWRPPSIGPADTAILQYTSGSTGDPKGVRLSHDNLMANARSIERALAISEASVGVSWLPPHHDMGLMGGILQPLFVGAQAVLLSPQAFVQRPVRWLEAITRYRATTCGAPNFAYELLSRRVSAAAKAQLDLSSWSVAFCGAEPVREETLAAFSEAFRGCGFERRAFVPCYGLAEATLLVSAAPAGGGPRVFRLGARALERGDALPAESPDDVRNVVSCGLPADGTTLRIVDPRSGREQPPGRVGEVWVKSAGVAGGYWAEAAGRDTFAGRLPAGDGPYLRTGDLGCLLDGELLLTGRLKDLIILRGRNLYPQDLEAVLERAHAAVRPGRSAAFSVQQGGAEFLVVACELRRRAKQDRLEVAEAIGRCIAGAAGVPPDVVVLVEPGGLPRTSSGKPRRQRCRSLFLEGRLGESISRHAPRALEAEA